MFSTPKENLISTPKEGGNLLPTPHPIIGKGKKTNTPSPIDFNLLHRNVKVSKSCDLSVRLWYIYSPALCSTPSLTVTSIMIEFMEINLVVTHILFLIYALYNYKIFHIDLEICGHYYQGSSALLYRKLFL